MDASVPTWGVAAWRPSWTAPPSDDPPTRRRWRRLIGRESATEGLLRGLSAASFALTAGAILPGSDPSTVILRRAYLALAALSLTLSVLSGIALIFARRGAGRRPRPAGAWWSATAAAERWFRLAWLACGVQWASAIGYWLAGPSSPIFLSAGLGFMAVMLALAFGPFAANAGLRRTVMTGRAPIYWVSRDHRWWWDGAQWVSVATAAPGDALRSRGGGFWWTGLRWLAVPLAIDLPDPGEGRNT